MNSLQATVRMRHSLCSRSSGRRCLGWSCLVGRLRNMPTPWWSPMMHEGRRRGGSLPRPLTGKRIGSELGQSARLEEGTRGWLVQGSSSSWSPRTMLGPSCLRSMLAATTQKSHAGRFWCGAWRPCLTKRNGQPICGTRSRRLRLRMGLSWRATRYRKRPLP